MKRRGKGGLFERLVSFGHLLRAFREAARGKRDRREVALFERDLEPNLISLGRAVASNDWRPGGYHQFVVHDGKPRTIAAAPFPDRVVNAALAIPLEEELEPSFVADTFAGRRGKGTHAALERLSKFLRSGLAKFALSCDITKFYASIDHARLLELLERRISDRRVLRLASVVVSSYWTLPEDAPAFPWDSPDQTRERPFGLPIGNRTSQILSTLALDPLDRLVKRELEEPFYVRYADDFVILSPSKERLHEIRDLLIDRLAAEKLLLERSRCRVFPADRGVDFLGFVSFPGYRKLRRGSGVRFAKRLRSLARAVEECRTDRSRLEKAARSWSAHASFGKTHALQKKLLAVLLPPCDGQGQAGRKG